MSNAKCFVKDCIETAPYKLRLPGILSSLPKKKRAYLTHCATHEELAEARRSKAMGVNLESNPPVIKTPSPSIEGQLDL